MERFCICTAANSKYFPFLLGLVLSVREKSEPLRVSLCVLDIGLTDRQLRLLRSLDCQVVAPGWDVPELPTARLPQWLQAMTSRPYLPKHFPGYDIYIWIDCDAWVQDWSQVEELCVAAKNGSIAIVRESDHGGVDISMPGPQGLQRILFSAQHLASMVFASYKGAFGDTVAMQYGRQLPFNSGVFALHADSPGWSAWQRTYAEGLTGIRSKLERGEIKEAERCVEQNALTLAIDRGDIPSHPMPGRLNWQFTYGFPSFDPEQAAFVVPGTRERVGIVHLVDFKFFSTLPIRHTNDGKVKETPVHYLPHVFRSLLTTL
jgi:hypothetical protein